MSGYDVDLFVIGAGSGGVRAARIAAGYGAKVMIAEEYRVGGTCVIRGCVPKKLMVYASRFASDFRDAEGFGWSVEQPSFDWAKLIAAKDKEITRLEGAYRSTLAKAGATLLESRAVLEGPHEVRLAATDRLVRAKTILIATGGAPSMQPAIPGGELGITSNEVFDLKEQSERILVIGGGYIAVEFAGIFQGLGSKVTLLHRGEKLLRGFDEEIRDHLASAYQAQGMDLRLGRTVEKLEKTLSGIRATLSDGSALDVDQVLVATGRKPLVQGLGLEKLGITLDAQGAIPVNAFSQTSVPSIYAVGDVTNRLNLTPAAIREGHAFADNVFGGKNVPITHNLVPTGVFSTPEIGVVGISEQEAKERGETLIYKTSFRPMKATLSGSIERVFMKLVVEKATDKVLGVHIMGEAAAEMIQLAGVALQMEATKADFDRTLAVHPSAAEELVTMRVPAG